MSAAASANVRETFEASRSIARLEGFYDELRGGFCRSPTNAGIVCPPT
jgi:hypothetical protein